MKKIYCLVGIWGATLDLPQRVMVILQMYGRTQTQKTEHTFGYAKTCRRGVRRDHRNWRIKGFVQHRNIGMLYINSATCRVSYSYSQCYGYGETGEGYL